MLLNYGTYLMYSYFHFGIIFTDVSVDSIVLGVHSGFAIQYFLLLNPSSCPNGNHHTIATENITFNGKRHLCGSPNQLMAQI